MRHLQIYFLHTPLKVTTKLSLIWSPRNSQSQLVDSALQSKCSLHTLVQIQDMQHVATVTVNPVRLWRACYRIFYYSLFRVSASGLRSGTFSCNSCSCGFAAWCGSPCGSSDADCEGKTANRLSRCAFCPVNDTSGVARDQPSYCMTFHSTDI